MKLKKIPALILFITICLSGYVLINTLPNIFFNDTSSSNKNCPEYIDEFVKNNPQAIELKENYQENENTEPIKLTVSSPDIPLFIQWDQRWAYTKYGQEIVGTAGCGPTSLAMVIVGLTGNTSYNPRYVAKFAIENNYLDGSKTSWTLMYRGCQTFGLKAQEVPLDQNAMIKQLQQGHPIICSVRPGDFTTTGHFIVITKATDDKFIINDPNSKENSSKLWSYKQLAPQIKAMWSYSLKD